MNDTGPFKARPSRQKITLGHHFGPLPSDPEMLASINAANAAGMHTCLQSHFELAELIGVGVAELDDLARAA